MCIYIAKQQPQSVLSKFEQLVVGEVAISTITYGELLYGSEKSRQRKKTLATVEELSSLIPPLPIPTEAGQYYGTIRAALEKKGKIIGNNDLWIAAHVLTLGITLVTNNTKEFSRIPHLKVENWVD